MLSLFIKPCKLRSYFLHCVFVLLSNVMHQPPCQVPRVWDLILTPDKPSLSILFIFILSSNLIATSTITNPSMWNI